MLQRHIEHTYLKKSTIDGRFTNLAKEEDKAIKDMKNKIFFGVQNILILLETGLTSKLATVGRTASFHVI